MFRELWKLTAAVQAMMAGCRRNTSRAVASRPCVVVLHSTSHMIDTSLPSSFPGGRSAAKFGLPGMGQSARRRNALDRMHDMPRPRICHGTKVSFRAGEDVKTKNTRGSPCDTPYKLNNKDVSFH
jgi:hypothetical protein